MPPDTNVGPDDTALAIRKAIRDTGQDSTEAYYAEMEAARNVAEDAYFKARPQLMRSIEQQCLFRAGFERAWANLWHFDRPTGAP